MTTPHNSTPRSNGTNATLGNACDNWYQGSNVPGKPRVFMPYVDWVGYVAKCREVVNNAYEGFSLR